MCTSASINTQDDQAIENDQEILRGLALRGYNIPDIQRSQSSVIDEPGTFFRRRRLKRAMLRKP
jgi:hypothetical protein